MAGEACRLLLPLPGLRFKGAILLLKKQLLAIELLLDNRTERSVVGVGGTGEVCAGCWCFTRCDFPRAPLHAQCAHADDGGTAPRHSGSLR